jgi:hypothetical protein
MFCDVLRLSDSLKCHAVPDLMLCVRWNCNTIYFNADNFVQFRKLKVWIGLWPWKRKEGENKKKCDDASSSVGLKTYLSSSVGLKTYLRNMRRPVTHFMCWFCKHQTRDACRCCSALWRRVGILSPCSALKKETLCSSETYLYLSTAQTRNTNIDIFTTVRTSKSLRQFFCSRFSSEMFLPCLRSVDVNGGIYNIWVSWRFEFKFGSEALEDNF